MRPLFECGSCGKGYSNPLGHSCTGGGDMAKRRRAAATAAKRAKQKQATAERRAAERARIAKVRADERARAAERVAKAKAARKPSGRPRPDKHDYRTCRDADCERIACEVYREGIANCPREHVAGAS